jgi:hypothetical protein
MIEDALVVGAISAQPTAQCGRANVERIGDVFRTKPEKITIGKQIDDTQCRTRQFMGRAVGNANTEFRRYRWQWPL